MLVWRAASILPRSALMAPLRRFRRVLLPLPLAPTRPTLRPASICQETPCSTGTPANVLKILLARRRVMGRQSN